MFRSLKHYSRLNAAVALGAAVATAVLTGALVVGDSVRGSLRQITLERLGGVDHALVSERFFRAGLAADLAKASATRVVAATLLPATAVHAQTRARATHTQIVGASPELAALLGGELDFARAGPHPPAIVNRSLQQQLGARVGDDLIVAFEREAAVPRESLFGRRASSDVLQRLRLRLCRVVEDRDLGRFGLRPHQAQPLNLFVPLSDLQAALDLPGRANTLLVEAGSEAAVTEVDIATALDAALTLEDFELSVRLGAGVAVLESRRFLIDTISAAAAERAAAQVQAPHAAVFTYMANAIAHGDRSVPYSTVTALDPALLRRAAGRLGQLMLRDGSSSVPDLDGQTVLLNEWAADELAVAPGDSITLSYYTINSAHSAREELEIRSTRLEVLGITAMDGLGRDPGLTPDYPGIQGARNMGEWSAPFPVDLSRIRERDEVYWETYGATPKAFVGFALGAGLWSNRFGQMTSFRIAPAPGHALTSTAAAFEQVLLNQLHPSQAGFVFQPVREQGLRAAAGATDFSTLFIGFSMFIIAAALLLVVLLFRLGVEQRISELGLLMAIGFTLGAVRRRFLLEGVVLAFLGGLIGIAGALGYAWAMLAGLRYLWQDAVGTPDLQLHIEPATLVSGLGLSVAIVAASVVVAVRRYGRFSVRSLLTGNISGLTGSISGQLTASRPYTGAITIMFAFAAAAAIIMARQADASAATAWFFVSAAALLCCGLSACSSWMKAGAAAAGTISALTRVGVRMGVRDIRRQPGRSMLCVSLVACACFVIVAVGASGREFGNLADDISNTGGFTLLAEADVPLYQSLSNSGDDNELGLSVRAETALGQSRVYAFRSKAGEDASCLNLYKPERPSLLGVPQELIERGGFRFVQLESFPEAVEAEENPWALLNLDLGPGVIPVFGDYNSVRWILQLQLGDRLVHEVDGGGDPVQLRLVGLLDRSVFQSELLMSMEHFERHFPTASGFGFFALDVPAQAGPAQLALDLERDLEGYGFDVMWAWERAARFQAVENTYLSTFQTLGGLGLILGTIGLAVVSIRNAIERSGELAVQRAFGFTRRRLYRMLLTESGVLLVVGVALGSGCALVAVLPHLGEVSAVPWKSLALTLALVVGVGMTSAAIAALLALRVPLLPALKSG